MSSINRNEESTTAAASSTGAGSGGTKMSTSTRTQNPIVTENRLPGSASTEWDVNGSGDKTIQGFGHDISVNRGETIRFKIDTDSTDYRIDVYRMGYYQGNGARLVDSISVNLPEPQRQPEGIRDAATRLYDCGNWSVSASWEVPPDAVSGIYFARLVRQDSTAASWRAEGSRSPPAENATSRGGEHAYGARGGYGKLSRPLREPRASHVYFVVRDDDSRSDVLFQTSDTTWQAYNRYGGHSTYSELDPNYPRQHGCKGERCRAYKVSYNRPLETRDYRAVNCVWNAEYPAVRWLEKNGYDVTYTTGVDSARRGHLIRNHRLFLSVGHDEYWSREQREYVEAARDNAGVHLAFWSANEVFWKIRWEPCIVPQEGEEKEQDDNDDDCSRAYRTMVCYKETHENAKVDPHPTEWTGTWRDGRPSNPQGARPENALTGTIFTVNAWRNDPLVVPAVPYGKFRFWRNTSVAKLAPGESAVLLRGLLGHEWDEDLDNGYRPPGLFRLSETTVDNVWYLQDEGSVFDSGTATHHLTLYRHETSGALVFGAGTVQWSWGLDGHHDTETGVPPERANPECTRVGVDILAPCRDIQQATVNLLADMGIQPATLEEGLVAATASTDVTPPRSTVLFPKAGATLSLSDNDTSIEIRGTAVDGEGHVAAVEVSVDGGNRWHPATAGLEEWRYDWHPQQLGNYSILCRAADDSGNLERPAATSAISVTVVEP